jgi:U3 small nucleolar RNA-associated protein 16
MFARLYKSAKAIFNDSAEVENKKPNRNSKLLRDETMVTTRQKDTQAPADHGIEEDDTINVYVPSSISKGQRKGTKRTSSSEEDEAEYVPPSTRKRKRLPVRAKDVESPDPAKTRPVVEIPAKKISPEPDHVNIFTTEDAEEGMEDKNDQGEEHDAAAAEILEKSSHRRLGSEPVEDEFFSTAREQVNEENAISKPSVDSRVIQDSEDEDSDDDAPEAVGMQEAAKSVKMKEEEAARVVKE